ncbi:MAG: transcriptional regulator with XRE-family HTH domain [Paraglaciecola sp.]|jgi:transcriptional regulator with XRE-family HTH domain
MVIGIILASGLSQPQIAQKIGIEQSYLSKLENDKSIPSSEIFTALLEVFELFLEDFLENFDIQHDRVRLGQIPEFAQFINSQQQNRLTKQRKYLYVCGFLLVLGTTLSYVGCSKSIFSERRYQYESSGIVLAGEANDVFENWRYVIYRHKENFRTLTENKRVEMEKRKDVVQVVDYVDRGVFFIVENWGRQTTLSF